jgi:hypothetical protein
LYWDNDDKEYDHIHKFEPPEDSQLKKEKIKTTGKIDSSVSLKDVDYEGSVCSDSQKEDKIKIFLAKREQLINSINEKI